MCTGKLVWSTTLMIILLILAPVFDVAAKTRLTVFTGPWSDNPKWLQAGIAAYQEKYPEKEIEAELVIGHMDRLVTLVASGTYPDVVSLGSTEFPQYVAAGIIEDLTPYVEKDNIDLSRFFETTVDNLRYRGGLYALPRDWSSVALLYNATAFAQRGVTLPGDWTWDDLVSHGRKLTFDADGDGHRDHFGLDTFWNHHHRWPIFVWQAGGRIWNDDFTKCLIDSPEAIRGLKFLYDLYFIHNIAPRRFGGNWMALTEPGLRGAQSYSTLFRDGRIAMTYDTRYSIPDEGVFDVGVAPLPAGPAGSTSLMVVGGLAICSGSDKKQGAWDLVKFLASKEGFQAGRDIQPPPGYAKAMAADMELAMEQMEQAWERGAMNWGVVATNAKRSTVWHPAEVSLAVDFLGIARGQTTVEAALRSAASQANSEIQQKLAAGASW